MKRRSSVSKTDLIKLGIPFFLILAFFSFILIGMLFSYEATRLRENALYKEQTLPEGSGIVSLDLHSAHYYDIAITVLTEFSQDPTAINGSILIVTHNDEVLDNHTFYKTATGGFDPVDDTPIRRRSAERYSWQSGILSVPLSGVFLG